MTIIYEHKADGELEENVSDLQGIEEILTPEIDP
jgi:hypothetical protein